MKQYMGCRDRNDNCDDKMTGPYGPICVAGLKGRECQASYAERRNIQVKPLVISEPGDGPVRVTITVERDDN